jgi:N-acetylglutamate synthase-like GNAT family acetyltransferase
MGELNRQKRQVLRHIQDHINTTRKRRGVVFEQASTVDIYHHPQRAGAAYNYVTPRRGVAWVPGTDVRMGLDRLAELDRIPRLELVKGLFPSPFFQQLKSLELAVETDYPLLTFGCIPGCDQELPDSASLGAIPPTPARLSAFQVADRNAVATWLRLGMAGYTPEDDEVEQTWENVVNGQEAYYIVSDDFTIAGGAGVILNPPIAEIICLDTVPVYRRRGIASVAIRACIQHAQANGCSTIFAIGSSDSAVRLARRLGFVDLDHVITYHRLITRTSPEAIHARSDTSVAQPVPST